MPIYEYVCEKCGHHLEIMQKISDKPLARCPECRGKLEKIISQTSFQLKGSGWYVSDYARAGKAGVNGQTGKADQADQTGQPEKTEKAEKSEKLEKPEKKEKLEKKEPAGAGEK